MIKKVLNLSFFSFLLEKVRWNIDFSTDFIYLFYKNLQFFLLTLFNDKKSSYTFIFFLS